MENASKALIIAGAILISILLIGVSMLVYESATGTVDEAVSQMSTQEKTMFNSQFTQYAGSAVSGSSVKALLNKVSANNAVNTSGAKNVQLAGDTTTTSAVVSAKTYKVEVAIADGSQTGVTATGLVYKITINANN